ncbi:hypothetical protein L873DRAFT_856473 [Choiromyces venosus 120613-1]|uniref:Uncharacterized protein n=1 Tax=Choiromyces venosus 120613-1 TaxID=1336337 RepID=A0A3N4JP59_9PEZI|nr:hypothetical protein L873DRAFT_856473 [Choiromyces venosus 120613-1]
MGFSPTKVYCGFISFSFYILLFTCIGIYCAGLFPLSSTAWYIVFDGRAKQSMGDKGLGVTNTGLSCSIRFSSQIPFSLFFISITLFFIFYSIPLCTYIPWCSHVGIRPPKYAFWSFCECLHEKKRLRCLLPYEKKMNLDGCM